MKKMNTYKIVGRTNGYIASRSILFKGKTEITLASGLSLEEALEKLDGFFVTDHDHSHDELEISYNEETGESVYGLDDHWTDYDDGTASYEYDSRYYSILEDVTNDI